MTLKEFDKYRGRYVLLGGFKLPIVGYDPNGNSGELVVGCYHHEGWQKRAIPTNLRLPVVIEREANSYRFANRGKAIVEQY